VAAVKRNANQSLSVTPMEHDIPPASPEGEADGGQVAGRPDRNPDYKRSGIKPWLYAVGVKSFI